MELIISNQAAYDKALAAGHFEIATYVWLYNLPGLTELPEGLAPAATYVWLNGRRVR